jgi:hypothetical protein
VENGDLNWIVPGKLVAFSGPAARPTDYVGFRAMVPEDYWGYYRRRRVTAVVRLNKKVGGQGWDGAGIGIGIRIGLRSPRVKAADGAQPELKGVGQGRLCHVTNTTDASGN